MATSYFFLKAIKRKRQKNIQKHDIVNEVSNSKNPEQVENYKCRTCLKDGSVPIYGSENSHEISEAVKIFGDIDITENDEFPKHLCDYCHSLLQGAILFRKLAKDAEARLLQSSFQSELQTEMSPHEACSDTGNGFEDESSPKEVTSYKCKLCKLTFQTHKEFMLHKNSKKHKNVRIQCPICFGLLTAQLYKKHLVRHESASHLICDVCGKLYRKDNLVRHMQLHSFDLPYQCQMCPYRGRFMESLKIHIRTHTGDKPFSCDKCQLRFLTRSNLNRHLLTHKKDRPFKCTECGRGFYTQRDMDVHFKSDHAGIKDFGCRMCGNKYGTRKALMRHELRVHKRDKMAKGRMPLYLQAEYKK